MEILLNPNVAYVLLVLGFMIGALALFAPGTGILEIFALICLALAGYGIVNLPVNLWAIAILLLSAVPLFISLRKPKHKRLPWLLVSSVTFAVGSAFLFQGDGTQPAVNPVLILVMAPLTILLIWFLMSKSIEASQAPPVFDLSQLIGMKGQASSDIRDEEGTVYVNGETWTASSKTFIPAGSTIRVLGRRGLTLEVEPAND